MSDLENCLTNILECLITYKRALINKYTLTSQKPSILNELSPFLRGQCALITQYMINREMPVNPSKGFYDSLGPPHHQWYQQGSNPQGHRS